MTRHTLNEAEEGFFDTLLDGKEHSKIALDLEADTAKALGITTVSPSVLGQLEDQAGGEETEPEEEAGEPEPAAAQVESFQRKDKEPEEALPPEPELPSRATHGKLFTDKRAHPLQLLDVLTMRYKTDWADWESDTLWWSLRRSFGPVGEVVRNKIMALRLAATTDVPWIDWDVFEDCGLSWNDTVPTIGSFQPLTPMQLAFALSVLKGIRPDDSFGNEVRAYVAAILDDHGWIWAPEEWFEGVQVILERSREHLVGLKSDIITTWKRVKDLDPSKIEWKEDDPRDIHVLKMFVVKRYLEEREEMRQAIPGAPTTSSTTSPPVPS